MRILYLKGSYSIDNINDVYRLVKEDEFDCIDYSNAEIDEYIRIVLDFYNENVQLPKHELPLTFYYTSFIKYINGFVSFSKILFLSCKKEFQKKYFYNNVIFDLYNMMFESVLIVVLISFFFGMNIGYQSYLQLREFGAADNGMPLLLNLNFKESGVLIAIFSLCSKYAASVIAKVGFMKVSEEWSALEIMNIDPDIFLFKTKIYALILLVPFFSYFSIIFSTLGSFLVFKFFHGINFKFFLSTCHIEQFKTLFIPLIKGSVIGGALGLISCYEASLIEKNSDNILFALNRGLVICITVCFVLNVLLDFIL